MGFRFKLLKLVFAMVFLSSSFCQAATLSGTVKGPDGAPFKGAFVQARNSKTRVTTMVLSDAQGRYHLQNIAAGDYQVNVRGVGFTSDPQQKISVGTQTNPVNFTLQKGTVRWNDLTTLQGSKLLPTSKGKDTLFSNCIACHGFQTRMAAVGRTEEGWQDRVSYMRDIVHFSLANGGRFTDDKAAEVVSYLSSTFGPDSGLPKSPADLPQYAETVRPLGDDSGNIVYVEYDLPGMNRFPFSAAPDGKGHVWVPNFGPANAITRVDINTGEFQDFKVPTEHNAAIHTAFPNARDGSVWLGEQATNKIGRWDPVTQKITEFQDAILPGKEGVTDGGCKHTVRFDPDGNVWSSGDPLSRYDPRTGKFTDFWNEVGSTYTIATDSDGNIWFTTLRTGQIGKIDYKTLKVSTWDPPTKRSFPRRLEIDTDGIVWFGEYNAGKIGRFDPKTEAFKEFELPGPAATPYALGIDRGHNVWYSSYSMDTIGRLDPKTGKVTEYPFPHTENTLREFFIDADGHIWYGSPANSKVGYLYLSATTKQN